MKDFCPGYRSSSSKYFFVANKEGVWRKIDNCHEKVKVVGEKKIHGDIISSEDNEAELMKHANLAVNILIHFSHS